VEADWLLPSGGRPCPMVGGPHISGGVFPSLIEYSGVDVWVFSQCISDMWNFF